MATTTNFGWETPDDTDYVKDGAAAMRTLGNSIDSSMADLKGGTTGQVLSKNSNTDMDFVWTNGGDITEVTAGTGISGGGTSGAVTITNSMATAIDAKGDLVAGTGADTFARLAVGSNNQVLTADSTTATGLKWATPSSGTSWVSIGSAGLTGATTITISGISGYNTLFIAMDTASSVNASSAFSVRFNSDSAANYAMWGGNVANPTSYASSFLSSEDGPGYTEFKLGQMGDIAGSTVDAACIVTGANTSGIKVVNSVGGTTSGATGRSRFLMGYWNNSATISSVSVVSSSGNFDAGTLYVYGSTN